ncbi:MAG: SDR family oxidoreductase [candidate division NC10 bacterium]|nr:SDR family oxidoreductase [candidate division NC10 bacterium]
MDLGLKGKVAIVAASSKGMGKATAMALAAEGSRVTVLARDEAQLRRAAEEIRGRHGVEVLAVPADVTHADDVKRVVRETVERWGTVHVLVNNAGGPPGGVFDDMDDAKWQSAYELNLLSTIRLVREVLPHMRKAGGGVIINLQSTSVKVPLDNLILSNTIRSGVIGLAKSLSLALAKDGIRVNNVLPGAIMTDRLRQMVGLRAQKLGKTFEELQRAREAEIPLGRIGEPEDVANMIVFLASDRARYVTGVTVQVDGGLVRSML